LSATEESLFLEAYVCNNKAASVLSFIHELKDAIFTNDVRFD